MSMICLKSIAIYSVVSYATVCLCQFAIGRFSDSANPVKLANFHVNHHALLLGKNQYFATTQMLWSSVVNLTMNI